MNINKTKDAETAFLCECGETLSAEDRKNAGTKCTKCKVQTGAPLSTRLDRKYGDVTPRHDVYDDYRP
jgi:hypothetical protein